MKVFVTGGCGFLGSHVCEYFIDQGWEAVSYDSLTKYELKRTGYATEKSRMHNWDFLKSIGTKLIEADIRDRERLFDETSGVDFIVHTAAQPAMTISWEDPVLDFTTNVLGTFNVLEAARKHKIPIVSCSSIHVYGNHINATLTEEETRYVRNPDSIPEETEIMQGFLTPLHASKRCGEVYVDTWINMYNVKAATFRYTGIYGPRQFGGEDHGWVANFSIRAFFGWPITIFGTGKQIRDILYATDAAKAFHCFYKNQQPGIYNIGGGPRNAISLVECIALIEELLGMKIAITFEAERPGDMYYFICDISKARNLLDFEPSVGPREGVAKLLTWIRADREVFEIK